MEDKKSPKDQEEEAVAEGHDSLYEKKWNAAFARLKAFKAKFGHCRVPNRYAEDPQLGNWVSTQRRQYRILTTGVNKTVPLTQERAQQLMALGFEWSAKDPSHKCWEDRFQELIEYKRRYGSTLVPMGWKENPRLATWVSTQRQEYKQLKQGHSSRLNEAKVQLLNEIEFVWEAQRGRRKLPNPMESARTATADSDQKPGASFSTTISKLPFQVRATKPAVATAAAIPAAKDLLLSLVQQTQGQQVASSLAPAPAPAGANQQGLLALIQQLQGGQAQAPKPAASLADVLAALGQTPKPAASLADALAGLGQTQKPAATLADALAGLQTPKPAANLAGALAGLGQTPKPAASLAGLRPASSAASQGADRAAVLDALAALAGTDRAPPQVSVVPSLRDQMQTSRDLVNLGLQSPAQHSSNSQPSLGNSDLLALLGPQKPVSQGTWQDDQLDVHLTASLIGSLAASKSNKKKPDSKKWASNPSEELASLLRNQGQQDARGVKRPQDELLEMQGNAQAPNNAKQLQQRRSSQGENAVSSSTGTTNSNAAKQPAPSLTAAAAGATDPMGVVRLYAATLPARSHARLALMTAPSVVEAHSILKADILRIVRSDSLGLAAPSQSPQQTSQSLLLSLQSSQAPSGDLPEKLRALVSGNAQQTTPAPSGDLQEKLRASVSGNAQQTAPAASLQPAPAVALPPAEKRQPVEQGNATLSHSGLSSRTIGSVESALSSGSESDKKMPPKKKSRVDP